MAGWLKALGAGRYKGRETRRQDTQFPLWQELQPLYDTVAVMDVPDIQRKKIAVIGGGLVRLCLGRLFLLAVLYYH